MIIPKVSDREISSTNIEQSLYLSVVEVDRSSFSLFGSNVPKQSVVHIYEDINL